MSSERNYYNFLNDRKAETSNFMFISKPIRAKRAFYQEKSPSPDFHKYAVLKSRKIQDLLEILSNQQNTPKEVLEKQVQDILHEIGYNKNLKVLRWIGFVLTKICLKTCSGLYLNLNGIKELKSKMGTCPVVFVPSHRSYADFIQLSYVCFTFDIAVPAIAAGMDFHSMWGMGKMLRDTGAFFMRRAYNNDSLYWTTFKQYVYQIVTKGDLPVEFFIEGTRSRSGKSLTPKYGLISMILKALFLSQVPDILFVPISICYDRVLEENLFAFEHLGIPKPKESTSGFFKSLKILKEKFGSTYIHFAPPISAKETFGDKLDRSVHNMAPLHQQEITDYEKSLLPGLAHEIVYSQQKHSVINVFNLIALTLNDHLSKNELHLTFAQLQERVMFVKTVLETCEAYVPLGDSQDLIDAISVHENIVKLDDGIVSVIFNNVVLDKINPAKLKGHSLSEKTMSHSIPYIMLQIYVNPTLHFFIDVAIVITILKNNYDLSKGQLFEKYKFLRKLFSCEFVTYEPWANKEFENALVIGIKLNGIKENNGLYSIGDNELLRSILCNNIQPYFTSYFAVLLTLENIPAACDEKFIFANVQRLLEMAVNDQKQFVHPYCLSLDTLSNCLNCLSSQKTLIKTRRNDKLMYEINGIAVSQIREKLALYVAASHLAVNINNHEHISNKL